MRAAVMYGAGDIRVEDVPDARVQVPSDAVVRVIRSCVCGSDLHGYHSMPNGAVGIPQGHEFIGVVEEVGSDVTTVSVGDFVVSPFAYSDGTCEFCLVGLQTSCVHGGFFSGAQAEAVRVPHADGTLVGVPLGAEPENSPLLPSLLTLADVFLTGHHAAVRGQVSAATTVTVIGDGAVGLSAVLAAHRLGAERIILMGRHRDRTALGVEFGATEVVAERGDEGIAAVRELTGGRGTHAVLEAVGHRPAYDMAVGVVRPGGVISRVGLPQYEEAPIGFASLFAGNITLAGGPAPVRAYMQELLPEILDGRLDPGRVFDRTVTLDEAPAAYQAMDDRQALKVLIRP